MKGRSKRVSWYFLELRVKDMVEDEGGVAVRSGKSRSPIDVVGIFPEKREIWLIQCKSKRELPKKQETITRMFRDLIKLKGEYKVRAFLYGKRKGRYQLVEL